VQLADRVIVLEAGRIALDLMVPEPHPRRQGSPVLAAIEGQIIDRILSNN